MGTKYLSEHLCNVDYDTSKLVSDNQISQNITISKISKRASENFHKESLKATEREIFSFPFESWNAKRWFLK